jgi:TonB family protein
LGAFAQEQVRVRQSGEKSAVDKVAEELLVQQERGMISQGGPFPQENVISGQPGDNSITFISEMAFEGKTVKGVPYSADAVTETVMVLGDGNRITRTTTAKLYRDSEGRTRREQSLNGIGAWAASEDAPQTVFINDPVNGANYVLNTKTQTAQKAMQFTFIRTPNAEAANGAGGMTFNLRKEPSNLEIKAGVLNGKAVKRATPDYPAIARAAGAQGTVDVEVTVDEQGNVASAHAISGHQLLQNAAVEAARQWSFSPTLLKGQPVKVAGIITFQFTLSGKENESAPGDMPTPPQRATGEMKMRTREPGGEKMPKFPETQESLGKQAVEGVQAEGSRTTVTIPAGAIGNERPIQIVSERWYSSDLQAVVMTRHSDPRFGETTYRLTNISRSEPDRSLFEVPAGYKVTDRGDMERRIMLKSPPPPQQ